MNLMDADCTLNFGYYRLRLWAHIHPHSASRAVSVVAELLVLGLLADPSNASLKLTNYKRL